MNYEKGDGRSFLARSDDRYDLVWFPAPDSYSAANAASAGAFVLSESYLYTATRSSRASTTCDPTGSSPTSTASSTTRSKPNRTLALRGHRP